MTKPNTPDIFKDAADYFRKNLPVKVGSSHSHQILAAYLGYNSKKALIDSETDLTDPNLVLTVEYPDYKLLRNSVDSMHNSPLKQMDISDLEMAIVTALSPPCECCNRKKPGIQPVGDPYGTDFPDGWVCQSCAHSEDEYARCRYCGDSAVYRADQINDRGECAEHNGESLPIDDEEEEDYESYAEYVLNH